MNQPLVEELIAAVKALALLVAFLTAAYWLIVDLPIMPFLVGEILGCMMGLGLLVFLAPRRRAK